MTNIYAALEIGTSHTTLAIGEAETGGRLKVACHARIPSTGVRKSQILDLSQATVSVRSVLKEIERNQQERGMSITIGNAFLVVSGQHVQVEPCQGSVQVVGAKVTGEDLENVARAVRSMPIGRDRELLDIVERSYSLDELGGIQSPKDMTGRVLKLDTLQIHADANRINDARTAAGEAHLELRDPLFAATCAADATLTDADRRNGTLVLDLGGGSTGYAVYADSYLAAAGVLGVGGDHITNDISHAFQTTNAQAEELKVSEASATIGRNGTGRVKIPGSTPLLEKRTISRHALDTVVNARCREIVEMIREALEYHGLDHRLHGDIVLTGGGAEMSGFAELLSRELGMTTRVGVPSNVDGLDRLGNASSFAAIAGALMYAHRNYEEKSFFQSLLGVFKK